MCNIQSLYNEGRIYEGTQLARQYIKENGVENSQLECFLLAKGLYAAGDITGAKVWISQTMADPINRIPLEEKINRQLGTVV